VFKFELGDRVTAFGLNGYISNINSDSISVCFGVDHTRVFTSDGKLDYRFPDRVLFLVGKKRPVIVKKKLFISLYKTKQEGTRPHYSCSYAYENKADAEYLSPESAVIIEFEAEVEDVIA